MNFHATVCILLFVIRQRNFSFCWVSNHQPVATVLEKPKTSWPFEIQKTCGRFLTAPGVFGFFGTGFQTLLRVVRLPDYSPVAVHQERKSWEKGKAHKADYSEPQSNFEKHEKKKQRLGETFWNEQNKIKTKLLKMLRFERSYHCKEAYLIKWRLTGKCHFKVIHYWSIRKYIHRGDFTLHWQYESTPAHQFQSGSARSSQRQRPTRAGRSSQQIGKVPQIETKCDTLCQVKGGLLVQLQV